VERRMARRSKHAVASMILNICKGGSNKTRIMNQANLNLRTVDPYTDLLIKNDLLVVKQRKKVLYENT